MEGFCICIPLPTLWAGRQKVRGQRMPHRSRPEFHQLINLSILGDDLIRIALCTSYLKWNVPIGCQWISFGSFINWLSQS